MKKASAEYVFQRGNGTFYFRRAVPSDLVAAVGKREWKVSLKTKDAGTAFVEANRASKRCDQQIAQLRGTASASSPIEISVPASDAQTISAINALLSRDFTMQLGRTDGRISQAFIDGDRASALLTELMEELNRMNSSTPLALDNSDLDQFFPRIEAKTGRDIRDDRAMVRELAVAYWRHRKELLEFKIARLKGDMTADESRALHKRKTPTVKKLIELFEQQKGAQWRPKTRTKFKNVSRVISDILGAETKLSEVNREVARDMNDVLHTLPTMFSSRKVLRGLSAREAAIRGGELGLPTLGNTSLRIYLSYASSIFEFAVTEDLVSRNPMKGLPVRVPKVELKRKAFTPEQVQKIFSAPIFTGCVDDARNWAKRGPNRIRRGRYWVPVLALHTGMRVSEICSLQARDICNSHGVTYFNVAANSDRELKTKSAARVVPVHHNLGTLGFLDWIETQRFAKEDFLFSELSRNSDGNRGDAFSKWFGFLRKSMGVTEPRKGIHAFRHVFADRLRETNPRREHLFRIMGWSLGDMLDVYGDGKTIKLFNKYVQKIEFRDYDITHLAR